MPQNVTITLTLSKDKQSLKFQATCEDMPKTDLVYLLEEVIEHVKTNEYMEGLTRSNGGYVEENIRLTK